MTQLAAKIEAILFLSTRPVSFTKLSKLLGVKSMELKGAAEELARERNVSTSGIHVVMSEAAVELATNPDFAEVLQSMSREEIESELTRPQLETLTIIAYRGPITKAEIEHIRGVNCSIILRNLAMRGFIVEKEDLNHLAPTYSLSTEILRHLGLHSASELPEFEKFNKNEKIDKLLATL